MDRQVRSVLLQQHDQAPDVPAPEAGGLVALGAAGIDGKAVVDEHQGLRRAQRLDIDEVAQRVLEVVHAVDERHLQRLATQQRRHIGPGEELIAGLREYLLVGRRARTDARLRVDAQRQGRRPHQPQGLPARDAHLQVGGRPHMLMHPRQHLEVVLARQLQLREQPVGLGVVAETQGAATQALRIGPASQPQTEACAEETIARAAAQARRLCSSINPGLNHCR